MSRTTRGEHGYSDGGGYPGADYPGQAGYGEQGYAHANDYAGHDGYAGEPGYPPRTATRRQRRLSRPGRLRGRDGYPAGQDDGYPGQTTPVTSRPMTTCAAVTSHSRTATDTTGRPG